MNESPFSIQQSSFSNRFRVTDGTRTRDVQDHNLALYQLSYGHHRLAPAGGEDTGSLSRRRAKVSTATRGARL